MRTVTAHGTVGAALFCDDSEWIARRKHTVELLDDRTVRHKLTVDITLPRQVGDMSIPVPCLAPTFMLRKAPAELTNFDYQCPSGSIPLPTREENGRFSAEVLLEIAVKAAARAGIGPNRVVNELGPAIEEVATKDTLVAASVRSDLLDTSREPLDIRRALTADPQFCWLSELLETNCIVGYLVNDYQPRQVLKLSFDENQLDFARDTRPGRLNKRSFGWEGYWFWFELPFIGSSSYHFEVIAPSGLEIIDCGVAVETPEGEVYKRGLGLRERTHVYMRGAQTYRSGLGWALFRVYRGGFITGAVLSTAFVVISIGAAAAFAGSIARSPTNVTAVLLLFPGALVALVYRPGQHELALRLLHHARLLLLAVAGVAFAVAARVAVLGTGTEKASTTTLRLELAIATCITALAFVGLVFTRLLPKVSEMSPVPGRYIEPTTSDSADGSQEDTDGQT